MTTGRNYQPGVLANSVGKQLHPQSNVVSTGGMTYKPQTDAGAEEAAEAHNLGSEGSIPSPATTEGEPKDRTSAPSEPPWCPMPTKSGDRCLGYPTSTGYCVGHSKAVRSQEMNSGA